MLPITPTLIIDESELHFDFIRAAGPGGQNVNKVSSAVQLRFNIQESPSLPEDVRQRLLKLAGRRVNQAGELVIRAAQYRTQEQNRADAIIRLDELIQKARVRPVTRKPTRPSASSKAARLDAKKKRGETKQARRIHPSDLE